MIPLLFSYVLANDGLSAEEPLRRNLLRGTHYRVAAEEEGMSEAMLVEAEADEDGGEEVELPVIADKKDIFRGRKTVWKTTNRFSG